MHKYISLFPIEIETLDEGGFLASCPTLQGCRAEGATYAEAIEHIEDVIHAHIEARKAHGDPLPALSVPQRTNIRLSFPLPVAV